MLYQILKKYLNEHDHIFILLPWDHSYYLLIDLYFMNEEDDWHCIL